MVVLAEGPCENGITLSRESVEVEDGQELFLKGSSGTIEKVRGPGPPGIVRGHPRGMSNLGNWTFPEDTLPLKVKQEEFNWRSSFTGSIGKMVMHLPHADSGFKISFIEDKKKKGIKITHILTSMPISLYFAIF